MDASGGAAAPSGQVVPAGAEDAGGDAAVGRWESYSPTQTEEKDCYCPAYAKFDQ